MLYSKRKQAMVAYLTRETAMHRSDALRRINGYADLAAEHLVKLTYYGTSPVVGDANVAGWLNTVNNKCIRQIYEANKRDRDAKKKWLDQLELLEALEVKGVTLHGQCVAWMHKLPSKGFPSLEPLFARHDPSLDYINKNIALFIKACLTNKPINEAHFLLFDDQNA
jgi:hypothetical protein